MKVELTKIKEIIKKISIVYGAASNFNLLAVDASVDAKTIYFNLYNGEGFVSFKLPQEDIDTDFEATVDTKAFIDIVGSLTAEEISLSVKDSVLKISSGKSNYKLAMVYDGSEIWRPTFMIANTPETEVNISTEILNSIDLVNTQELSRVREDRIKNGAGKLYYLSNNGCFTSANNYGACLNSFQLDTNCELLLNKNIVKLFKLFKDGVILTHEESIVNSVPQVKITLRDDLTLVTMLAPADKTIRAAMLKMVYKLKEFASAIYQTHLIINAKDLASALSRLNIAAKHSNKAKDEYSRLNIQIVDNSLTISDTFENSEVVDLEENSLTINTQIIRLCLEDIKPVVDLCKAETIELDTNTNGIVVISFDNIKYFLTQLAPEK